MTLCTERSRHCSSDLSDVDSVRGFVGESGFRTCTAACPVQWGQDSRIHSIHRRSTGICSLLGTGHRLASCQSIHPHKLMELRTDNPY